MKNNLNLILLVVLILISSTLLVLTLSDESGSSEQTGMSRELMIKIATDYHNNELYRPAIEQYEKVIHDTSIPETKRSNILYKVAEIYKDELRDYEGALKSYLLLRHMFPNNGMQEDIEKGIIECLDNLGRSAQAQSRLERIVSLGKDVSDVPPDQMVARIGDRAITLTDLYKWLNKLPQDLAKQYTTPEKRYEFLQTKVADQLLYDAAIRAGYDNKPKISDQIDEATRQILAGAYYKDHVKEGFTVNEEEVLQFYEQYKDDLFEGKKFGEVRDSVYNKFREKKIMEMRMNLSRSLFDAERVQFYPNNLGLESTN